jgi:mannose-6-phosphate isomerase-like protein (cupin superfamily)
MAEHTVHEDSVPAKQLPGRSHKMIVRPDNLGATTMCAGVAVYPSDGHAPPHVHPEAEEILYVLEGKGAIHMDGKAEAIREGVFIFVPKGVAHSLEATTGSDLKVFYVFSPPVVQGSYG